MLSATAFCFGGPESQCKSLETPDQQEGAFPLSGRPLSPAPPEMDLACSGKPPRMFQIPSHRLSGLSFEALKILRWVFFRRPAATFR